MQKNKDVKKSNQKLRLRIPPLYYNKSIWIEKELVKEPIQLHFKGLVAEWEEWSSNI